MAAPKVAIIGVGLLGGSLALALKGRGGVRLEGWNHRASSRRKAARILKVARSFEEAVAGAKVVVLCAHSGSIAQELRQIRPLIEKDTLVLDVSSVKGELVGQARTVIGMEKHFVPCHPMAGKEKSGPLNADKALYRGKVVFITPLPKNPPALIRRAESFWRSVGAIPVRVPARTHDQAVALTSHLPHLLAATLMELYGKAAGRSPIIPKAVGTGFRDLTRIAAGNPTMWRDIVAMNAVEIRHFLRLYLRRLGELERNLGKGRNAYWSRFFTKARSLREKLS